MQHWTLTPASLPLGSYLIPIRSVSDRVFFRPGRFIRAVREWLVSVTDDYRPTALTGRVWRQAADEEEALEIGFDDLYGCEQKESGTCCTAAAPPPLRLQRSLHRGSDPRASPFGPHRIVAMWQQRSNTRTEQLFDAAAGRRARGARLPRHN